MVASIGNLKVMPRRYQWGGPHIENFKGGQIQMLMGVVGWEQGQGNDHHPVTDSFQGQFCQGLF